MASMATRVGAVSFVFALVVSACTPTDDTTGDANAAPGQASNTSEESVSGDTLGTPEDAELPAIPILYVSEPIVAPGDTVTVTADARRRGTVVMGLAEKTSPPHR